MTEPNGAIPITTTLKTKSKDENKKDFKGDQQEPGNSEKMSSQSADIQKATPPSGKGFLQIGTNIDIPAPRKSDGSIDMDVVKSFINFHYIPVESLKYLKERIEDIRRSIITSLVGDVTESKEGAKNELQIRKAIIVLENTLLQLSADFSRIRHLADTDFLGIRYGIDRVEEVTTFYGSDFFLEGESQLLKDFALAPNPIERKTILNRLTETRYRNNPAKLERQFILNNLMPFVADADFTLAITNGIDKNLFALQNRFVYWIQVFEAEHEDIVIFFNNIEDATNAEKFIVINNLILEIINGNTKNQSV